MADTAYGAPQKTGSGGGVGGFFQDHPSAKWIALGGVVLVAYLYYRNRQAAASSQALLPADTAVTTSGSLGGTSTDIGSIGQPTDLASWTNAALKMFTAGGPVDPLQAENAIYRFTNGLPLDAAQQAIISKIIAVLGNPPGGPFGVVTTPPPPPPPGTPPKFFAPATWHFATNWPKQIASGTGNLVSLGSIGVGNILNVIKGAPVYASKVVNGKHVWVLVTSLTQFLNLPKGTTIATLKGEQVKAA